MTVAPKKKAIERDYSVFQNVPAYVVAANNEQTDSKTIDKKRVLMCHLVVLLDAILESLQTISIQKPQGSDVYVSNDTK